MFQVIIEGLTLDEWSDRKAQLVDLPPTETEQLEQKSKISQAGGKALWRLVTG